MKPVLTQRREGARKNLYYFRSYAVEHSKSCAGLNRTPSNSPLKGGEPVVRGFISIPDLSGNYNLKCVTPICIIFTRNRRRGILPRPPLYSFTVIALPFYMSHFFNLCVPAFLFTFCVLFFCPAIFPTEPLGSPSNPPSTRKLQGCSVKRRVPRQRPQNRQHSSA